MGKKKTGQNKTAEEDFVMVDKAANAEGGNDPHAAMSAEDRKTESLKAKDEGNKAFAAKNFEEAVKHFSNAISYDATNHVFFSNRSASNLSLSNGKEALRDAKECVKLKGDWAKAHSRLGAAQLFLGNGKDAEAAYAECLKLDANFAGAADGLAQSKAAQKSKKKKKNKGKDEEDEMMKMYKRMQIEENLKKAKADQDKANMTDAEKAAEREKQKENVVIGIDLGTTYSCVGYWDDDQEAVEIIANEDGNRTTPSYVAFTDAERLIGDSAKNQCAQNVTNTVYDAKRMIGQGFDEHAVQQDIKRFPFKVASGPGGKPQITVQHMGKERTFFPEEISAMILVKMKEIAEQFIGKTVKKAVITVPAYFNDQQRQATKDAGAIAGLEVLRIINEPTAASLAYGHDASSKGKKDVNVLIFDLGGGTFDVSLLSITEGVFEVKAISGDTHLGGEDFDNAMLDWVVDEFKRTHKGKDFSGSDKALRRARSACERAKRQLSSNTQTTIEVDSIFEGEDLILNMSRAKFEKLNEKPFLRCLDAVKRVLKDAAMETSGVDEIVLVGGSTRIPRVQQLLREYFDGKELCKSVNPDEAVAYGAAVQGAILSGTRHKATEGLLLVDVTPLSLGIEVEGRMMSTIVKRNTSIPCRKTETFTTTENFQTEVDVCIYEGERASTDDNNLLGKFVIAGVQRAKRGEPKVEVTFDLDANGILKVTARDTVTNSSNNVVIENDKGRLSAEDIERMVKEAEEFKDEDAARKKQVESKNELENLVYQLADAARNSANESLLKRANEMQEWLDENQEASGDTYRSKIRSLEKYFN